MATDKSRVVKETNAVITISDWACDYNDSCNYWLTQNSSLEDYLDFIENAIHVLEALKSSIDYKLELTEDD